jgi:hypothetical protein
MKLKGEDGQFTQLSDQRREVRSIRLTDRCWMLLGEIASQRGMTRADLLEKLAEDGFFASHGRSNSKTLADLGEELLRDPIVTRNGKDTGAVRRVITALLERAR